MLLLWLPTAPPAAEVKATAEGVASDKGTAEGEAAVTFTAGGLMLLLLLLLLLSLLLLSLWGLHRCTDWAVIRLFMACKGLVLPCPSP